MQNFDSGRYHSSTDALNSGFRCESKLLFLLSATNDINWIRIIQLVS